MLPHRLLHDICWLMDNEETLQSLVYVKDYAACAIVRTIKLAVVEKETPDGGKTRLPTPNP